MEIQVFTSEAAAAVTKAELRSLETAVRKAQRELGKAEKALSRAQAKYAKQQAVATPPTTRPRNRPATPVADPAAMGRRELITELLEQGKISKRVSVRGVPIEELREMLAKRTPSNKPKPKPSTRPKPKPASNTRPVQPDAAAAQLDVDFKKHKQYDHSLMKGKKWHNALNASATVSKGIEGYWRPYIKPGKSATPLPFPIRMPVAGYNKRDFVKQLEELERNTRPRRSGRGHSTDRWTGKNDNGSGEFESFANKQRWRWPQGYMRYIKGGVPPTREFYKFVTGEDNPNLPSYPVSSR